MTRATRGVRVWLLAAGVGLSSACADTPADGAEGASCLRLAECAPGLACVDHQCTSDLTRLAEAGMVPELDSGMLPGMDATTPADSAVTDQDAGN